MSNHQNDWTDNGEVLRKPKAFSLLNEDYDENYYDTNFNPAFIKSPVKFEPQPIDDISDKKEDIDESVQNIKDRIHDLSLNKKVKMNPNENEGNFEEA